VQPQVVYPLRFEPIFQPRIWGGRRLADLFQRPLPGNDPIGEAWVLSDRDDFPSRIADGPLKGQTLHELLTTHGKEIFGRHAERFQRFPLLLKFLDARETLSVQVHPSDRHTQLLPPGERGKTEAWVVLQAEPQSRIYAGLKPGTTCEQLQAALDDGRVADHLASFTPKPGDGVFLEAGTVHALGGGVVLFEVQQNSDVTFRLHDWDRIDAKTGKSRQLHIEQSLACTDFSRGAVGPVAPIVEASAPVQRERLFDCPFFQLRRITAQRDFDVTPRDDRCLVLVALAGRGELRYHGHNTTISGGDVLLLPAALGECKCSPLTPSPSPARGEGSKESSLTVLEIALPE
jgi:mannose-6-phosphate isomerase